MAKQMSKLQRLANEILALKLHPTTSQDYDAGYIAGRNDAASIIEEAVDNEETADSQDKQMADTELKPCPFCGSEAEFEHSYREDDHRYPRDFWHVRIRCCNADTGWMTYGEQEEHDVSAEVKAEAERDIATFWNSRATPASTPTSDMRDAEGHKRGLEAAMSLLKRMSLALDDMSPEDTIGYSNGVQWVDIATVDEIRKAEITAQASGAVLCDAQPVAWKWSSDNGDTWHVGLDKPARTSISDPDIIIPLYTRSPSTPEGE